MRKIVLILLLVSSFMIISPVAPLRAETTGGLSAPEIQTPEDIAEIRGSDSISFIWRKVEGAARYRLVVAKDRAFKNIVFNDPGIGSPSSGELVEYQVKNLQYGNHAFRVIAIGADGREGQPSETRIFIIGPPVPYLSIESFEKK